jgi:hypothetical protein
MTDGQIFTLTIDAIGVVWLLFVWRLVLRSWRGDPPRDRPPDWHDVVRHR